MITRAVVLAAGRGTRMQRPDASATLSVAQREVAQRGLKAMIPVGRPFLDYVLSGLADAGLTQVCLVLAPSHEEVRAYYSGDGTPERVRLTIVEQEEPRGTADAVLQAEEFADDHPVIVVNADNLYPRAVLDALRRLPRAGLAGFRSSTLVARSNIPAERVRAYALIATDRHGILTQIVEKPDAAIAARFGPDPLVSMNAWLLPPTIFDACRVIGPSVRGELELQDAVRHSIEQLDESYRVIESSEGVLDLSRPEDVAAVAERLRETPVRP